MKRIIPAAKSFLSALFVLFSTCSHAQQQLTHTVTTSRCCNVCGSVFDTAIFHNKTAAIILATPVLVNGVNPNPHPVAAYFMYLNNWSIFNLDGYNITVGAKYNIEYWLIPDSNHFVYVVPQRINNNDKSYINNGGLNNHPNAQIRVFPRLTYVGGPGNTQNKDEVKMTYDATVSKWYISNVNNTPIPIASAYSIVIDNGPLTTNPNGNNTGGNCNCVIPTTLPPSGQASGDLVGTYPDPMVRKILGRNLSFAVPKIGQVLKWTGNEWGPANDSMGTGTQTGTTGPRGPAGPAGPVGPAGPAGPAGSTVSTGSTAKSQVLFFNQTTDVYLRNPNVNSTVVPGLDNQTFRVDQNSHIVFNTVISVLNYHPINTSLEANPVEVWVTVEILNASNQVVGRSVSEASVRFNKVPTINSVGIGILPAGTYHTKVTVAREANGYEIGILESNNLNYRDNQAQMIIQIIPD